MRPNPALALGVVVFATLPPVEAEARQILISEAMASNVFTLTDEFGDTPDWIELWNPSLQAVSLRDFGLSDDREISLRWRFPDLTVPAGAYVLVMASGRNVQGPQFLHTNFRISTGETVCLTGPDGAFRDCLAIPDTPSDVSVGRDPATGSIGLFATPTPGWANAEFAYAGRAPPAVFGRPAGFYPGAFDLTVESPADDGVVAFTLDGSEPVAAGSSRTVVIPVDSTRVVRAQVTVPGQLPGPVMTRTYLLESVRDLPVVSISTAPSNLVYPDASDGVYLICLFDGICEGITFLPVSEIPIHMEWFEPGGEATYSADAGMSIIGALTRILDQKSVAVFARSRYGPGEFRYRFFPDRPSDAYEALVFRNSGHDWNVTMLRDGFMHALTRHTAVDRLAYRPTIQFLNGKYWGILNAREKPNEHYLAQVGGADPQAVDLIEYNGEIFVIHGDLEKYQELVAFVGGTDMRSEADIAQAERLVDLDNFIDYQVSEIYFANTDWPARNVKLWRPRTEGGKWRWILFDTDMGFGLDASPFHNTLAYATSSIRWPDYWAKNEPWSTFILRRLLRNPEFRRRFINRFADLLNTDFGTAQATAVLDSIASQIESEIPAHRDRWYRGGNLLGVQPDISDWNSSIDVMRDFARIRPGILRTAIRTQFYSPGDAPVTVQSANGAGGRVRVNRVIVGPEPWTGTYFTGVPVTVTALPSAGYEFGGWTGSVVSASATIDVDPGQGITLTAHFSPVGTTTASDPQITRLAGPGLSIYPNPSPGIMSLLVGNEPIHDTTIEIYDVLGRLEARIRVDIPVTVWRARSGASGLRIARLLVGGRLVDTKTVLLVR